MSSFLIIGAYLALSALTYIRMIPICYRRAMANNRVREADYPRLWERWSRGEALFMAGWRAALWPYALFHELVVVTIHKQAWKPVVEERARHDRLVKDRDEWRQRERMGTPH